MSPLSPATLLRNALRVLVPLSIALTVYLYLYPAFSTCAFPLPSSGHTGGNWDAFVETARQHLPSALGSLVGNGNADAADEGIPLPRRIAPFRLLALGDPQLEGDTSIPNAHRASFPHLNSAIEHITFRNSHSSLRERVRRTLHDIVDFYFEDIPDTIESVRKRVDLFGNDFYLAHIYRTLHWWAAPTHVAVLGDLLGSQWVDDAEFEKRARRYWDRVVRGAERVPDELALFPADEYDLSGYLGSAGPGNDTGAEGAWSRRIINIAGNHDIGYAGDINEERLSRFERLFGKANYELRFELPLSSLSPTDAASVYDEATNPSSDRLIPELRIVNLNDMNLDTPALSSDIQDTTYNFVNAVINTASAVEFKGHFTLLLTHIPLYKPEGVCVDAPFFAFHDSDGTLKEQNQLSADASKGFLEGVFGMHGDTNAAAHGLGRRGLIINGHDHEGCDTYHFINQLQGASFVDRAWEVMRWGTAREEGIVGKPGYPGIREITLRSMMGEFGGNAGLLSVWFDTGSWEWQFEFSTCALGRQHFWWVVHILDLVTIVTALAYGVLTVLEIAQGKGADKRSATPAASTAAKAKIEEPSPSPTRAKAVSNGDAGVKKGF